VLRHLLLLLQDGEEGQTAQLPEGHWGNHRQMFGVFNLLPGLRGGRGHHCLALLRYARFPHSVHQGVDAGQAQLSHLPLPHPLIL
jgi:hypothetical protein